MQPFNRMEPIVPPAVHDILRKLPEGKTWDSLFAFMQEVIRRLETQETHIRVLALSGGSRSSLSSSRG